MENDDLPVGRLLTRRQALALLGASGAALVSACSSSPEPVHAQASRFPSCIARPEQTAGPYFVDQRLNRSDLRPDPATNEIKQGVPLALTLQVSRINREACIPVEGAHVDLWQCDALGVYSNVRDPRFSTIGQQFLRGYQITDGDGAVRFTTIYPGWYPGRTVHIHFKIRTAPDSDSGYEFTSQLYFDDAVTDRVFRMQPYAGRGERTVRNEGDGLFRRGGDQLMLALEGDGSSGFASTFDVGLQY